MIVLDVVTDYVIRLMLIIDAANFFYNMTVVVIFDNMNLLNLFLMIINFVS